MEVLSVTCPKCGTHTFFDDYIKYNLYVCNNVVNAGFGFTTECDRFVACRCCGCGKELQEADMGLRGDVYECKECGKPQWGYTEYRRDKIKREKAFRETIHNGFRNPAIRNKIYSWFNEHPEYLK